MSLPPDVITTLAALVPRDALRNTLGRGGRGGGALSWRNVLLDEDEAARLLNAEVPALRGLDGVRHLSAHRSSLDKENSLLTLQVAHLPPDQRWEHALLWPVVRQGASVLVLTEQSVDRPVLWPQRLSSHHDAGSGDYAVVTVDGTAVGVQVDLSGVVHLGWSVRLGGRDLRTTLLTRRGPRAAVELVRDSRLLEV